MPAGCHIFGINARATEGISTSVSRFCHILLYVTEWYYRGHTQLRRCSTRVRDQQLVDVVDHSVGSQLVLQGDDGLSIQGHLFSITAHLQNSPLQSLHWGSWHDGLGTVYVLNDVVLQQVWRQKRTLPELSHYSCLKCIKQVLEAPFRATGSPRILVRVSAGILLKASFVGAKIVYWSSPSSMVVKPAAAMAVWKTNVGNQKLKFQFPTADPKTSFKPKATESENCSRSTFWKDTILSSVLRLTVNNVSPKLYKDTPKVFVDSAYSLSAFPGRPRCRSSPADHCWWPWWHGRPRARSHWWRADQVWWDVHSSLWWSARCVKVCHCTDHVHQCDGCLKHWYRAGTKGRYASTDCQDKVKLQHGVQHDVTASLSHAMQTVHTANILSCVYFTFLHFQSGCHLFKHVIMYRTKPS